MHYRIASPADAAPLASMNLQLIRDEHHRNPMTLEQLEFRMSGWLANGEYQAVIFGQGDEDFGYILYRLEPDWLYIRQLWVRTSQRCKGIGREVIAWMLQHHWQSTPRLGMEVLAQNAPALAFWRAMGFEDYALTLERNITRD